MSAAPTRPRSPWSRAVRRCSSQGTARTWSSATTPAACPRTRVPSGVIATVQNTFTVGSVQVAKVIAGDGGAYVNGPFTVSIACTREVSGETVPVTIPGGETRTLSRAEPRAEWTQLPNRATCSVSEVDGAGVGDGVSIDRGQVTVGDAAELVTVTNTFQPAGFTVSKSVDDGGAVDQDGGPVRREETFAFTTSCQLAGNVLALPEGYRAFTLERDQTKDFSGLPVGAVCTVTETDSGTAASTTHVVTEAGAAGPEQDGVTSTVTLRADTDGAHVNAVDYTNHYTVGSLRDHQVRRRPRQRMGDQPVPDPGQLRPRGRQPVAGYDGARFLDVDDRVWTIDDLPTGATCTVTEDPDNDGGANFTLFQVGRARRTGAAGVDVTIGDESDPTPAVSVINLFGLGSLQVTKIVDGDTDELPAALDGSYTVSLACTRVVNGVPFEIDVPGGPTRVIQASDGTGP